MGWLSGRAKRGLRAIGLCNRQGTFCGWHVGRGSGWCIGGGGCNHACWSGSLSLGACKKDSSNPQLFERLPYLRQAGCQGLELALMPLVLGLLASCVAPAWSTPAVPANLISELTAVLPSFQPLTSSLGALPASMLAWAVATFSRKSSSCCCSCRALAWYIESSETTAMSLRLRSSSLS